MGRIISGFIAGMLAVLVFHQGAIYLLKTIGMLPPTSQIYNMSPLPNGLPPVVAFFKSLGFAGWPVLFNQLFWGGLLGAIFGAIHHKLPGGVLIIKGLIYGLIVVVVSNWIIVPLVKSQALFAGFVAQRMLAGALIQASFGLGVGLFYSLLRRH